MFGSTALPKASSTPIFGASTPAAATPSLFGASSAAATPSFTFPAAQSGPASTPLFGATPAAPATGASPFGGFSFGPSTTQPGGLTAGQPGAAGQVVPLGGVAGAAPTELSDAVRALEGIAAAYTPSNPRYRFQHLLLNVVENPASRVKPPNQDELQWREALQRAGGPDNPDHLWPVQAQGFKDLLARRAAQEEALKEQKERLETLKQTAAQLSTRQQALIQEQLEGVRRRQVQLTQQLLQVLRYVDALEGRFAQAMGMRSPAPRELMQQLQRQLAELEAEVAPGRLAGSLHTKAEALAAAAQLQARRPAQQAQQLGELEGVVGQGGLESAFQVLSQYAEALEKLQDVVRRNGAAISVLQQP